MTFKIGDEVTWFSQSSGIGKHKLGKVERVIPSRMSSGLKNAGRPRYEESYLVRATTGRLYWPRVSALKLALNLAPGQAVKS